MVLKLIPFILIALLLVTGCAHYPRNARLASNDSSTGYRFRHTATPTNSSDLLLMLAFSGGGTRAASLSYGVLEELARTPVVRDGTPHRMLDEVDSISSVSGGSFTAAYYALWLAADVLIVVAGLDLGWALRMVPNQLYYAFWTPFVYFRFFSASARNAE